MHPGLQNSAIALGTGAAWSDAGGRRTAVTARLSTLLDYHLVESRTHNVRIAEEYFPGINAQTFGADLRSRLQLAGEHLFRAVP